MDMQGRTALVTGAGTGIGQGIAIELGRAGYNVVVHYNGSKDGAEEAVCKIVASGQRAKAIQADLTDMSQVRCLFQESLDFLGSISLYVNNSGVTKAAPFAETTPELFDQLVSIDLKSAYFCVQEAANSMVERNIHGNIVVITSNNAMMQRCNVSVYGMMKAALVKMVKHAAIEYAKDGIRVNSIAPGWTATPRVLHDNDEKKVVSTIPLKRMALPEEIGKMVLFYASDAASSITGNCLVADGGFLLLADEPKAYGL